MIRKVVQHPANILRSICFEVDQFDQPMLSIVKDMTDTMRYNLGIGLSAPQVNEQKRIIVIGVDNKAVPMINPRIIRKSPEKSSMKEGCLSLPGVFIDVVRPKEVEVEFHDLRGVQCYFIAQGVISHIIQHEIDHLNGALILDYV